MRENAIYGVDIQPIAIQISKLRFFISLVLDQKIDQIQENGGIRPLPNLETKFVSANTLIALEKPEDVFYTETIKQIEKQIKTIRHEYFTVKTQKQEIYLQEKNKELRKKLQIELKKIGYSTDSSQKIALFDIFDPNASAN